MGPVKFISRDQNNRSRTSSLENQESIQDVGGKMQGGEMINLIAKISRVLNSLGDKKQTVVAQKKKSKKLLVVPVPHLPVP